MQCEPTKGDLCIKCWQKLLTFHEFYVQIESLHDVINKNKDDFGLHQEIVKVELPEQCDQIFSDGNWSFHSDPDEILSQNSFGKCRLNVSILIVK